MPAPVQTDARNDNLQTKTTPDGELETLFERILDADSQIAPFRAALQTTGNDCSTGITPLLPAPAALSNGHHWLWKTEYLTTTGAFKIRGAMVAMMTALKTMLPGQRHFFASSTGNHALAVLHAAALLRVDSVTLVLPDTVVPSKQEKLAHQAALLDACPAGLRARVVCHGDSVEAAHGHARQLAETARQVTGGGYFIHPFADPAVLAGQGTVGLEMVRQLGEYLSENALNPADFDELLVISSVGGGGLLSGTATGVVGALRAHPFLSHLSPRFVGLQLASPDCYLGDAIRVKEPDSENLRRLNALGVVRLTMTDPCMRAGMEAVYAALGSWVEGPAGGAVNVVLAREEYKPAARRLVISLLSGGNVDMGVLAQESLVRA